MLQITPSTTPCKNDVVCSLCGKSVPRQARQQIYCSAHCRLKAFRANQVAKAIETHPMARPTGAAKINAVPPRPSQEVPGNAYAFQLQNRHGRAPHHVLEAEIFGAREWRRVVSSDGVVCEVSTLRKRTLRDRGAS